MPYKIWVVGEEVLAADFNTYVQEQTVMTFTNAAARTAAISAPKEGMVSFLADTNRLDVFQDGAWSAPASGAVGRLGRKLLTGTAGFNNLWYDISAGGITINTPASRTIRLEVDVGFYLPGAAGRRVNVRIERDGGALASTSNRVFTDICHIVLILDDNPPAGAVNYRVSASTDHSADVPVDGGLVRSFYVSDAGPAIP